MPLEFCLKSRRHSQGHPAFPLCSLPGALPFCFRFRAVIHPQAFLSSWEGREICVRTRVSHVGVRWSHRQSNGPFATFGCLCSCVRDQEAVFMGVYFWASVLFHWSVGLPFLHHHSLDLCSSERSLELSSVSPPTWPCLSVLGWLFWISHRSI